MELKRPGISIDIHSLLPQIDKYKSALTKCLKSQMEKNPHIEVICILGDYPKSDLGENQVREYLRSAQARCVTYDELVENALTSYSDYMATETLVSEKVAMYKDFDKDFEST